MSGASTGQMVHQLAATAEIVALKKENAALGVKTRDRSPATGGP